MGLVQEGGGKGGPRLRFGWKTLSRDFFLVFHFVDEEHFFGFGFV